MENEVVEKKPKPQLFGMLLSPGEQLGKIRQNPQIWGPLLIVTLLYIVASIVSALTLRAEDIMIPGMTLADAEGILDGRKIQTAFSGFLTPVISIVIMTAIYMVFVKIARKDTTFKQLFSMNIYVSIIGAVGVLFNNLIVAAIGGKAGIFITSLAGLLNSDSLVLATVELFSIWQLILTGMGLYKVGQLSKAVSIIIIVVIFLVSLGFAMLATALLKVAGI